MCDYVVSEYVICVSISVCGGQQVFMSVVWVCRCYCCYDRRPRSRLEFVWCLVGISLNRVFIFVFSSRSHRPTWSDSHLSVCVCVGVSAAHQRSPFLNIVLNSAQHNKISVFVVVWLLGFCSWSAAGEDYLLRRGVGCVVVCFDDTIWLGGKLELIGWPDGWLVCSRVGGGRHKQYTQIDDRMPGLMTLRNSAPNGWAPWRCCWAEGNGSRESVDRPFPWKF